MVLGAVVVELHTLGVDARQQSGVLVPRVDVGGQTVEGGIHAEHDDFELTAFGSGQSHIDVMAAHADVLHFALLLQLPQIVHQLAVQDGVPFAHLVDDMQHAHFDMVGAQQIEQVGETAFGLCSVTGAFIRLSVPETTYVPLDNHAVATPFEGMADIASHQWVGVVDVYIVDAAVEGDVHVGSSFFGGHLFEGAAANAYFADS